jgi:cobalt-zinc-cadmium efflux system membrane fusion protein
MGDKIKVKISAAASESFEGQVTSIAPASDPQSKSFPVKIELVNPEQIFKPGMFAEVELAVAVHDQVLLLPKEAIVDKGDIRVVYLVRDGWTHETKVKTGISDANSIIILEGLQAGDQVVAVGQNTVQDQTPVEVVQDPSEVITDGN